MGKLSKATPTPKGEYKPFFETTVVAFQDSRVIIIRMTYM
jgi:hypothetical protein